MRNYWKFMIGGEKEEEHFANKFFLQNRNNGNTYGKSGKVGSNNHILLTKLVKYLHNMKYRVFFVDITPADIRKIGLIVVKVLISGLQPMYFGTNHERLNLPRLLKVTSYLGYNKIRFPDAVPKLNLAPHPLG